MYALKSDSGERTHVRRLKENMNGHSLQELMYIQVLSGGGRMREQLCKK